MSSIHLTSTSEDRDRAIVVELDKALRENPTNLAQRFFAQAAKIVDSPWSMAAEKDLGMPGAVGSKTPMSHFLNWYVANLHICARSDSGVAMAFQNVTNLLAPPQSLLKPALAARFLSAAWLRFAARNRESRLEAAARGAF